MKGKIFFENLAQKTKNTFITQQIIIKETTLPNYRKYVKDYGFLSFARKFGDKYGKKSMDTATKTGIETAKTASISVVQTGDLIGNKIANKITSVGKSKSKQKKTKSMR